MNHSNSKKLACFLCLSFAFLATAGFGQEVVIFDESGVSIDSLDDPDLLRIELPDPSQVFGDLAEPPVAFFVAEDSGVTWQAAPDLGAVNAEAEDGLRVEVEKKRERLIAKALTPRIEVTPPKPKVVQEPPQIVRDLNEGKVLRLYAIRFDFDKATLRPEATQTIRQITEALNNDHTLNIIIEGHTDTQGEDAYNHRLSQCRAQAVVDALIRNGIASNRLTPVGMGETRSLNPNDTSSNRQLNRRVEVRRRTDGGEVQSVCQDYPALWFG